MEVNPVTAEPMMVITDNGGGMDPSKIRWLLSLGMSTREGECEVDLDSLKNLIIII